MGQTKSKAKKKIQEAQTQTSTESTESTIIFSYDGQLPAINDFTFVKKICRNVHKAWMVAIKIDDKLLCAIRIYHKKSMVKGHTISKTKAEKHLMKMNHPFIIQLQYIIETPTNVYQVYDLCAGGELCFHLLKQDRFPEETAKYYAAEIVCALSHLMSLGIVYGSFSSFKLLLDSEGHICLPHFGHLKTEFGQTNESLYDEYTAPEVLSGVASRNTIPAMWWSYGNIVFEMLTGKPYFYSENAAVMFTNIAGADVIFPPYISNDAKSLIEALLIRDPSVRLGSGGGNEVKAHPWFEDIVWDKIIRKEIEPPIQIHKSTYDYLN